MTPPINELSLSYHTGLKMANAVFTALLAHMLKQLCLGEVHL